MVKLLHNSQVYYCKTVRDVTWMSAQSVQLAKWLPALEQRLMGTWWYSRFARNPVKKNHCLCELHVMDLVEHVYISSQHAFIILTWVSHVSHVRITKWTTSCPIRKFLHVLREVILQGRTKLI